MENKMLARLVLKQVHAEPERFSMDHWGYNRAACGTVACLAGWALLVHGGYRFLNYAVFEREADNFFVAGYAIGDEAQHLLGMSDAERYWGDGDLFMTGEEEALERFTRLAGNE